MAASIAEARSGPEARSLHRYFVESITEYALFSVGPSGRVESWNASAQRIFGYTADDIVGKPFDVLFCAEDIASGRPAADLAWALEDGSVECDRWHQRADGTRFWGAATVQLLLNNRGRVIGFSNIIRDATERHAIGEALRNSDERFRLLVESVADYAIFVLSPTGHIRTWNSGAVAVFGYASQDVLGSHISRLFLPSIAGQQGRPDGDLSHAVLASGERWFVRRDGSSIFATVRLTALEPDSHGLERGSMLVLHDITFRKYGGGESSPQGLLR